MSQSIRLDKLLSNLGYGSRREVELMAAQARITWDGMAIAKSSEKIPLGHDLTQRLRIDNQPPDPLPGLILMLHKPLGMTCSHKDAGALVYDCLPARWRRRDPAISTVGRLDKETSGLLLMTDDGTLLHRIISPHANIAKRYLATLDRPLQGHEAELFATGGLMLEGEEKPLKPAVLEVFDCTHVALTIYEGRYHQVRRMFAAVGNHVLALHRTSIGQLSLPQTLQAGAFECLDANGIAKIFAK